jgi:hypothetical protein
MEGAGRHGTGTEVAQARAHLTGGALGKGKGEHALGRVGAGRDSIGDAVRNGTRLSRARTGEHSNGPTKRGGHLTLFVVKSAQNEFGI